MTEKIYLETLKSVLGRSIFHYCLAASVVQTKQHSLKPTNKKKIIALFIQYYYKREVYCERTV